MIIIEGDRIESSSPNKHIVLTVEKPEQSTWTSPDTYFEVSLKGGDRMDEKSLDVFARAKLFLYKTQLAKLGVGADLRVVRAGEAKKDDSGEKKHPEAR